MKLQVPPVSSSIKCSNLVDFKLPMLLLDPYVFHIMLVFWGFCLLFKSVWSYFAIQPFVRPKPLSSRQVRHDNVEAGLPLEKDTKHTFKAKWTLGHYTIKGKYSIGPKFYFQVYAFKIRSNFGPFCRITIWRVNFSTMSPELGRTHPHRVDL